MIDKFKQNTTLKVCLDDVGTHNKAILDFFFAKLGQHIFRCVDTQEAANVLLVDYDFPPARLRYESEYRQWQKPALVLSISEVSLENATWLAKPLTSRALLDAAEALQQQLANKQQTEIMPTVHPADHAVTQESSAPEASIEPSVVSREPSPIESSHKPVDEDATEAATQQLNWSSEEQRAERILHLCGTNEDVDATSDFTNHYVEDSFFLSSLKDAVRLARQCQQGVLLNFPQARIYVLPEIHRVFCGINIFGSEFTALIASCHASEGGKMHILSTGEIHELNDMISQQASALYDLESFVWTSTLLSANGELPRTLDPKKTVALKHWPSLTRLERFPHVMPIAAQWSAKAMNTFDVAKSLNIPQRYVFSFYNAANSLGLIEQDSEKLINKKPSVPPAKGAPRGLFSRLLKRLVGG